MAISPNPARPRMRATRSSRVRLLPANARLLAFAQANVALYTAALSAAGAAERDDLTILQRIGDLGDSALMEHTWRVGLLARALAVELGLGDSTADAIRRASYLHDLGKVAIPDAVLHKPGRLSEEEFAFNKLHTQMGALLLGGSGATRRLARTIALFHHERWDGSGYPYGIAGERIPLPARIVSVADVFDALTHQRVYKPAWAFTEAVLELIRESGRHHDPVVVRAFLRVADVAPNPFDEWDQMTA